MRDEIVRDLRETLEALVALGAQSMAPRAERPGEEQAEDGGPAVGWGDVAQASPQQDR